MSQFDYAAIAADDPGGSLQDGVEGLRAMTVSVPRDSYDVNVRIYASNFGMADAEALRQVVEANFPAWVHDAFVGDGLNVCDPQTQAAFTNPPFSDAQIANMLSLASEDKPKYPGIRQIHVKIARNQ